MLKRDELATQTSCLNRAADDEPIFVLRANDENAAPAVAAWARDYLASKGGWSGASTGQQKKYTEAMDLASNMRIWKMHQCKRVTK
jgi:hypothetical protein